MMVQWLKAPTALAKNASSVPSTHFGQLTTDYNSSSRGFQFFWLLQASELTCIDRQTDTYTHIHFIRIFLFFFFLFSRIFLK